MPRIRTSISKLHVRWNGPAWAKVKRDERMPRARNAAIIAAFRARGEVIRMNRVRSGEMARSFRVRRTRSGPDRTWYYVENTARHYDWQARGVGPIYPVRAKRLRFRPKGSGIFVYALRTPGHPGGRFLEKAARSIRFRDFVK